MQAKHTKLLGERPFAVIGNVIPLPAGIQLAAVEVIVWNIGRLGFLSVTGVGLDPSIGCLAQIAWQTDERKTIVPSDRNQRNHATGAAVIRHDNAPPFTRRRVAHAALM